MNEFLPHLPTNRILLWSDAVYAFQETVLALNLSAPLYIVGGAVRDALLNRPIKDLDLTTPADAIRVARQIANALDGDIFVMDAERGVARVFLQTSDATLTVDVTRFRSDTLVQDLQERDFTINAMAVDLTGDLAYLIDPCDGETDAKNKLLRRCSKHALVDDPVRALRAIRQSVQLTFRIDPATAQDIRSAAPHLVDISPERVRDEFYALLNLDRVSAALRVADSLGVLEVILPEVYQLHGVALPDSYVFEAFRHTLEVIDRVSNIIRAISYRRTDHTAASFGLGMIAIQLDRFRPQLNTHLAVEWANGRTHTALLVFAAILHATGNSTADEDVSRRTRQIVERIADDFRLSGQEKKRLSALIAFYPAAQTLDYFSPLEQHRFWHQAKEAGIDACILALAEYLAHYGVNIRQDEWLIQVERVVMLMDAYFNRYDTTVSPAPFLTGNDLIEELQISPGKIIGEILDRLREAQVIGEVTSREQALQFAREQLTDS
jgi:tRNA nucleotidyltransferase/poly(A) polymerase